MQKTTPVPRDPMLLTHILHTFIIRVWIRSSPGTGLRPPMHSIGIQDGIYGRECTIATIPGPVLRRGGNDATAGDWWQAGDTPASAHGIQDLPGQEAPTRVPLPREAVREQDPIREATAVLPRQAVASGTALPAEASQHPQAAAVALRLHRAEVVGAVPYIREAVLPVFHPKVTVAVAAAAAVHTGDDRNRKQQRGAQLPCSLKSGVAVWKKIQKENRFSARH